MYFSSGASSANDPLHDFLKTCKIAPDPEIQASALFAACEQFCRQGGRAAGAEAHTQLQPAGAGTRVQEGEAHNGCFLSRIGSMKVYEGLRALF